VISAPPATSDTHARLIAMGFEGTVLKRQSASYRPGRTRSWRKLKARHELPATVADVREDRDGRIWARCALQDGRRCTVWADARAQQLLGQRATVVYSRTDADGSLREPRLLQPFKAEWGAKSSAGDGRFFRGSHDGRAAARGE
jgi:hypothetical protein